MTARDMFMTCHDTFMNAHDMSCLYCKMYSSTIPPSVGPETTAPVE